MIGTTDLGRHDNVSPGSITYATKATTTAYADGSCLGNPGPGGWAVLIYDRDGNCRRPLTGEARETTNNRMELLAAINALEAIGPDTPAVLFMDSEYVVRGLEEWLPRWMASGWRTASRKTVANIDLWERLGALYRGSWVRLEWVRGHSGHPLNEAVDRLARAAAETARGRLGR